MCSSDLISAAVHLFGNHTVAARHTLAEFIQHARRRDWEWLGLYADLLALLAAQEGRSESACRMIGFADAAHRELGAREPEVAQARAMALSLADAAGCDAAAQSRALALGATLSANAVATLALALPGARDPSGVSAPRSQPIGA